MQVRFINFAHVGQKVNVIGQHVYSVPRSVTVKKFHEENNWRLLSTTT